jgi:hypothetical protein
LGGANLQQEPGDNKITTNISAFIQQELSKTTDGWDQHINGIKGAFKSISTSVDAIKGKIGTLTDVFPGGKSGEAGAAPASPTPAAMVMAAKGPIDVRVVNDLLHVVTVKEPEPERQGFWGKLWGGIKDVFQGGASAVSTLISGVTSGIGGLVGGFIGGVAGGVVGGVLTPWVLVDLLKEVKNIVTEIIHLILILPILQKPVVNILTKVEEILARVQSIFRDVLAYVTWIVEGFAADGWLTKTLKGFVDSLLIWVADRIGRVVAWAASVLNVLQKWLLGTISVLIENTMGTFFNTFIGMGLARILNFTNAIIGIFWGMINGIYDAFKELVRWLEDLFKDAGKSFANAIIRVFNSMGSLLQSKSQEIHGTLPFFPVFTYTPIAEYKTGGIKPLDLVGALQGGYKRGEAEAEKLFPTGLTSESVKGTPWGKLLSLNTPLRDTPAAPKLPGLELPEVKPAEGHPTKGQMGAPHLPTIEIQGGLHITVQAGSIAAENLDQLARVLGERVMDELERVGKMRLARQGATSLVTP